jgi:V/A-type H+-transporting ATPase subunit I
MIVPMKKVSLVILESRRRSALTRLRKVGVVHIQSAGKSSQELETVRENISLIEKAFLAFPQEKDAADAGTVKTDTREALRLAAAIAELAEQRRIKREEAERFIREIEKLEPWGDFSPETLGALNARGLFIRLYELNKEQARSFPPAGLQYTVFANKAKTGKVVISVREGDFPEGYERSE